jgi:REP element-mobilizing transposase RayT
MNRGIARRMMFERRDDMAVFLDQIGEASGRGAIEVHAYCVMGTHYHLLVRSPNGELSAAMQRVQTEYSRWFNRSRRRDGALVRGRYAARTVDSLRYRRVVVSYIDRNPVSAGIVARAAEYPYGSAHAYSAVGAGPDWLNRSWIESCVRADLALERYEAGSYEQVFGRLPDALARVVEARWHSRADADPLDDLVASSPARVVEWMLRKAKLADGVPPGMPILDACSLDTAIREAMREEHGDSNSATRCRWDLVRIGLGRELCGEDLVTIALHVQRSRSAVSESCRLHTRMLGEDEDYARRVARVTERALRVWVAEKSD